MNIDKWKRVIKHLDQSCLKCDGGWVNGVPCACVYKAVFTSLFNWYTTTSFAPGHVQCRLCPDGMGISYSRPDEEFLADFDSLVARVSRRLNNSEFNSYLSIWQLYYLC